MDSKDVIKSDVLEETQWLFDTLREAVGRCIKLKFLVPFIAEHSIRKLGLFGLMGSDKMIELVEELCSYFQVGEKAPTC